MTDPDRMVLLGTLPEIDYSTDTPVYVDRPVHRDYDQVLIPAARLDARGRAALRALLDKADNEIAGYRLRTADLSGIDLGVARAQLAGLGFGGADLGAADWGGVGRVLASFPSVTGFEELRRLHALLTADETPEAEATS